MTPSIVARRYAKALYEEAAREELVESVDDDIDLIRAALEGSRELVLFFESPVVSRERKESVIRVLFGDRVQAATLRFLRLLVEKRREDLFPAVVRAYRVLRDEQLGIVEAQARVARPLSEAEQRQLIAALERMTGNSVRLRVEPAPGLLGGLVVRVGDVVYDGSVRNQLAGLRERMRHGAMN